MNIVLILLPLFFYKYFADINDGIIGLLNFFHLRWPLPEIRLMLPVGISFYTFMAIGYTIDVYNEEIEAEKNIGIVALFLSFFPLILSGPIERSTHMIPQFKAQNKLEFPSVSKGLKWMLWGYFMKLVVADRLGIYVDAVFNNIGQHNGTTLLFASLLYPFQEYADFAGYSLIAIGTAKVLGLNVSPNFNRPFFATSMSEFWRRWHISLISWLTDYVYTPLSFAYRKYKKGGIVLSLMITFMISGIWHAATLPYIVWGFLQGLLLSLEAITNSQRSIFENKFRLQHKAWYTISWMLIIYVLFSVSEVFAKVPSMNEALLVFARIFSTSGDLFIGTPSTFYYGIFALITLLFKDIADEFMPERFLFFENKNKCVRILSYSTIVILILLIGVFDGGQFIYFQF